MGIFRVEKKDLNGNIVDKLEFKNTILNAGLVYLCTAPGNDFNQAPSIGVGTNDITPDINQINLITPLANKTATYAPGTSTQQNPQGNKTFSATVHFSATDAIGDLTEVSYYMASGVPLNRTLFSIPGLLDTRFSTTPELDQAQVTDVSNLTQVYGSIVLDQTFTAGASGGYSSTNNLTEVALSFASSGNPATGVSVSICADNAGQPGTVLGTTTVAAFSEPVQRWRIATFSSPITIVSGTVYHIVVSASATDLANCYDFYGSVADSYAYGILALSTNGGTSYTAVSPSQDLGFKTYYTTTGATNYQYAVTMVQYGKETALSAPVVVNSFPVNNLDSTSTSQGTVRLALPTSTELPSYVKNLNIYKNVGGTFELLASVDTVRQYFYDNGSLTPNSSVTPPVSSIITPPSGVAAVADNTNGGQLQIGQNKYYKVSSLLMGANIPNQSVGPFVHPGVSGSQFYDSAYNTISLPLLNTEYETTPSSEIEVTSPNTNNASFVDYFTESSLSPSLWNITNSNADYYSLVTPNTTNESQLQLNVPAGVPFVISSTRQVRPGQSYYLNVQIPFIANPIPQNIYVNGSSTINPVYTNSAPNRVPIFSFVNPNNVQTGSADKRLTLEVGLYNGYRTEDMVTTGDTSSHAHGPMFCLYDNVGNTYFFSTTDIAPSHADGSYTFQVNITSNGSMSISVLNANTHSFQVITSSIGEFSFTTQYNGSHTTQHGQPGPTTQVTDHFLVPQTYSFAVGNPSNDPLSFAQANYIANNDSLYTIPGLSPVVPVPAICMTSNGSINSNNGGFGSTISWNAMPGVRKYRIYATATSGQYNAANGNLLAEYNTYYPCYAVQSTSLPNNDFNNGLVAVGNNVQNWLDIGVTYGLDATTTGNTNGYALGGFVGSNSVNYGNPLVPAISQAPGSAEGFLLLLTAAPQKALFTFTGGGFGLVAETGPDRGMGALYIDGNFVENIDFYTEERLEQQTVFVTSNLTPGYHTATIQPTGMSNDFSLGISIALDYFYITVPAIVDTNTLSAGAPLSSNDSHIAPVPAPYIKNTQTYNGNGPTVITKGPAHTLDVTLTFSLINPNL